MPRISVLPIHLINKIAAGEVVERPASVVKELLENSLDAGSRSIVLEVEDGGKRLIRISDDGVGMEREDLALAVHPHATSKITCEDDLYKIMTMGFRGEALASIASISQLEIVSRTRSSDAGYRIEVNGGQISEIMPVAAAPGTTISVRNLFFNTPARRKFLRTTNTEIAHISEDFGRIALAHCDLGFTLIHNGRKMVELPAGQSLRDRLRGLFSADLADDLLSIERNDKGIHVHGLIAPPAQSKNAAKWQFIFLNGRPIRDKFIGHAMKEAYRGLVEASRYPVVFLFIEIDPAEVDVNVHPTKMEVRFADSHQVHSQVLAAMRDKLLSSDLTREVRSEEIRPDSAGQGLIEDDPEAMNDATRQRREGIRAAMADFFKNRPPAAGAAGSPVCPPGSGGGYHNPSDRFTPPTAPSGSTGIDPLLTAPDCAGAGPAGQRTHEAMGTLPPASPESCQSPIPFDGMNAPGTPNPGANSFVQVHNSYIVQQSEEGLVIVDQHALHERILYEQLNRQLCQGRLASQRLLLPEVVEVTAQQMAAAENHAELLEGLGLAMEPFGPRSLAVQSYPVLLQKLEMRGFVTDLLDLLAERGGHVSREEMTHTIVDMMACKAAVKAGDSLSEDEIRTLLGRRQEVERISNCPHGRPTTVRLSLRELEKLFKRT